MGLASGRARGAIIATTAATALGIGTIIFAAQSSADTTRPSGGAVRVQPMLTYPPAVAPAVKFTVTGNARGTARVEWDEVEAPPGVTFNGYSVWFIDATPPARPTPVPGSVPPSPTPPPYMPPTPVASQRLPITARSAEFPGLGTSVTYEVHVQASGSQGVSGDVPKSLRAVSPELTTTPATAVYGAPVTLRGVTPKAGGTATLERRASGTSTWIKVATVRSGANRQWTLVTKPAETTAYRVSNAAGDGAWPTTMTKTVTVRFLVSVKASATRPKANQKITVSGAVRPVKAGAKVSLQRKSGATWVTIAGGAVKAGGTYAITKPFAKGKWPLRVVVTGGGTLAYGASSQVTVTVK